jgi:hypothetical protein
MLWATDAGIVADLSDQGSIANKDRHDDPADPASGKRPRTLRH